MIILLLTTYKKYIFCVSSLHFSQDDKFCTILRETLEFLDCSFVLTFTSNDALWRSKLFLVLGYIFDEWYSFCYIHIKVEVKE